MKLNHVLSALLPLCLLVACGGSGGSGGSAVPASGTADAFLSTVSYPELFVLDATIAGVELRRADGTSSANLLSGPVTTELVGLENASLWTVGGSLPAGTWTGGRVVFEPGSIEAKGVGGAPLALTEQSLVLESKFEAPLVLGEGGYGRVELHLDLFESLGESSADGGLTFTPVGSMRLLGADEEVDLEPFFGLVVGASLGDSTIEVEVYRDAELAEPLRATSIQITDDTLLIDITDVVFPGVQDFFAALQLGLTVVEVQGTQRPGGDVLASVIEITDQGGNPDPRVVIEGLVLFVDGPAQEFVLLIQDVVQGDELADEVLESIGDPSSIDVVWTDDTVFFDGDGELEGAADISEGQMVSVEFLDFSWPPFPASKVELEGLAITGKIQDIAGLPESFVLEIGGGELVTVYLTDDSDLRLDIQFKPAILVEELAVGMKATVHGSLHTEPLEAGDGDVVDDGVDAEAVKVHHGHLIQADVAAADELLSTFWTSTGKIVQTFGIDAPEGPLAVVIRPGCTFKQDASSEASFFQLAASGADLDIKVKGIGSATPGEIHAYEVKTKAK